MLGWAYCNSIPDIGYAESILIHLVLFKIYKIFFKYIYERDRKLCTIDITCTVIKPIFCLTYNIHMTRSITRARPIWRFDILKWLKLLGTKFGLVENCFIKCSVYLIKIAFARAFSRTYTLTAANSLQLPSLPLTWFADNNVSRECKTAERAFLKHSTV